MRNGLVVDSDGTETWWLNGELHREDGPAIIYANGIKKWYLNGKLHRVDGPAFICPDGSHYWYVNGNEISKEIKEWQKQYNIPVYFKKWNEQHKMLFKLQFFLNNEKRISC